MCPTPSTVRSVPCGTAPRSGLCRLGDIADGLALLDEGLRRRRETGTVLHTTMGGCLFADACLLAFHRA